MTRRFQNGVAKLPHEQSGEPKAHGSSEIRKGDHIGVNENTRAEQMKKLIDPVATDA